MRRDSSSGALWFAIASSTLVSLLAAQAPASPREWDQRGPGLDPPRDGQIVFNQQPLLTWALPSDTHFYDSYGDEWWERQADNILLAQDQSIGKIVWWACYGLEGQTHQPPAGDETIRLRFYASRPADGLPDSGNILFEQTFVNVQRIDTGRIVYGVSYDAHEYQYEADLVTPVPLLAGSSYWIEIAQLGDVDSTFRWQMAQGLVMGHAVANDLAPDWAASSGSLAFQLWTVPEPCGAPLLLCSALWFMGRFRSVRSGRLVVLCAALLCVFAAPAAASPREWDKHGPGLDPPRDGQIVFEQQPNLYWGYGSDTAFRDEYGYERWQREADNVVLNQDATIGKVVWWGFYGVGEQSHDPPAGDETMRVRFYAARAGDGLPDDNDILFEQTFLNPQRVDTGRRMYFDHLAREYRYEADMASAVSLAAGTTYWIEVAQIGDIDSTFRWETSYQGLPGHSYINDLLPDWWYSSSNTLAFELWTVPEPCGAALLLCSALWFMGRFRSVRSGRLVVSCAALLCVFAAPAAASPRDEQVVFEQLPWLYWGYPSDTLYRDSLGYERWQREADNVMLSQDQNIGRVVWWGFYGGEGESHLPPAGDETMRLRVYAARQSDGLPDDANILSEETFLNPQRVATGRIVYGVGLAPEYRYEVDLAAPVLLATGNVYWFELAQIGDADSMFRWSTAPALPELHGHAYVNDLVSDWHFNPSDSHGLQLWTVPEPSTACLLLAGTYLFSCRDRKRPR